MKKFEHFHEYGSDMGQIPCRCEFSDEQGNVDNDTDYWVRAEDALALSTENAALKEEVARLREALEEVKSRTGMLLHQNLGRWDPRQEHIQRAIDVLTVNQKIAKKALEGGE